MAVTPQVNIVIPQGADFSEVFESQETDGTSTNLDNFTAVSSLKKHPGAGIGYSFTVGVTSTSGEVSIAMTSGVTVQLKPGRYYYDVYLTSPSGGVSRMVGGMAEVTPGIST